MATMFQIIQFLDGNGDPLDGGKVYWKAAGTDIDKDTWVDEAESAVAANPVTLDNEGRPDHGSGAAAMWLRGSYKFILKDKDLVTIATIDDINMYDELDWTGLTASIADLNSTTTTALLKTSVYTVALGDRGKTILVDATAGAVTINLPAASTLGNTFKIIIKKIDKSINAVTIQPAGTETIDYRTPFVLSDYFDFIEVQGDASNFHVVASQIRGTVRSVSTTTTLALSDNNKLINCNAAAGVFDVNLPSAATVGKGWRIKVKKIDASTNTVTIKTTGAETLDGATTLGISAQYFAICIVADGVNYYIEAEYGDTASGGAYPLGYLRGFLCAQDAGDTNNHINFGIGAARGENNLANITLRTAMIKSKAASWAEGTGNGGFPTGIVIANNTCYHCFVIAKVDGITDAGFDSDINATNLLADAVGYIDYKRVGSFYTEAASTNIRAFIMIVSAGGARQHRWTTLKIDYKNSTPGAGSHLAFLKTPVGIKTKAIFNIYFSPGYHGAPLYISDPDQTDQSGQEANNTEGFVLNSNCAIFTAITSTWDTEVEVQPIGLVSCITNTSSQIRYNISIDRPVSIATIGWDE